MDTPTSAASTQPSDTPGRLLAPVLADLEQLIAGTTKDQFGDPTPCTEFDVQALRGHVLNWVTYFAAAVTDPDGSIGRPDLAIFTAPDDPAAAAGLVRDAAAKIATAVADGVAERPVLVVQTTMPGESVLRMVLWEYVTHGSDLAKATAQPWNPPAAAVRDALTFGPSMLSDEYRGEGKSFGPRVPIADDAPVLDQLLAFSGREPHWKA